MAVCGLNDSAAADAFAVQLAGASSWALECAQRVPWASLQGHAGGGLVGTNGVPVACLDNATWGVSKAVCDQFCSYGQMPSTARFSVVDFVNGFNNFFLFWVALTAQLPFETGGLASNLMCLFISVGSPTLITFSLAVTISNRRWAKRKFDRLTRAARGLPEPWRQAWVERTKYEKFFLEEAQQEPLRIDDLQEFVRFVSLETPTGSPDSWKLLHDRLQLTRRGFTASLFAQTLVAVVAWILTIMASFMSDLGSIDSALQTAAGTIWMWLLPVVTGWVMVGTQTETKAVEEALERAFTGYRRRNPFQKPIRANTLTVEEARSIRRFGGMFGSLSKWTSRQQWLYGPDAHGDGIRHGPLYNYARAATWWQLARSMEQCADERIQAVSDGGELKSPTLSQNMNIFTQGADPEHDGLFVKPSFGSQASSSGMPISPHGANKIVTIDTEPSVRNKEADSFSQDNGLIRRESETPAIWKGAYPSLTEFFRATGWRLIWPVFMAAFIQLGTTLPAFVIALFTPPVGLGCSTGSYLVYLIASFLAWFLLGVSALISHSVRHYEQLREQRYRGFEVRTIRMSISAWLAFLMLWSGKLLAVANCWWLIITTLFELCGFYNTCFCYSSYVGLGSSAWVVLLKSDAELRNFAQTYWIGAMSTAGAVWVVSMGIFALLAGEGRMSRWWVAKKKELSEKVPLHERFG